MFVVPPASVSSLSDEDILGPLGADSGSPRAPTRASSASLRAISGALGPTPCPTESGHGVGATNGGPHPSIPNRRGGVRLAVPRRVDEPPDRLYRRGSPQQEQPGTRSTDGWRLLARRASVPESRTRTPRRVRSRPTSSSPVGDVQDLLSHRGSKIRQVDLVCSTLQRR